MPAPRTYIYGSKLGQHNWRREVNSRWGRWHRFFWMMLATTLGTPQGEPSAVAGKVLSPDGKPISGARVWLVVNRWKVGKPTVESSTVTDKQGNFRLPFKLPLRVYYAYAIAFHPNFAVGWQSFDPRDLKPLTVQLHQPAPLAGIVITPDGKRLAGAKVQVWSVESIHLKTVEVYGVVQDGVTKNSVPFAEVNAYRQIRDEEGYPHWLRPD